MKGYLFVEYILQMTFLDATQIKGLLAVIDSGITHLWEQETPLRHHHERLAGPKK